MAVVTIITPVLNEADNIFLLFADIKKYCTQSFELIYIDDGSNDDTLKNIDFLASNNMEVKCISLSRNFGHQNALMSGMQHASGDYIIIMDGDLQHPPSMIPDILQHLQNGIDVVNTRRISTAKINYLKQFLTFLFYSFINKISETRIEPNVSDFKGFNKKVLAGILKFGERELFLRGIFSWIGFTQITLDFDAPARLHGKTKYTFGSMFKLALKGTTSFSFKPLRIAIVAGSIISLSAFLFALYALFAYFKGETVAGWASTIIALMLLGGTQLLAIGLLGEYIASLFTETKRRPLYLIDKKINLD